RRAQAREVAAVAGAAGALVARLAAPAPVVRLGQVRDPGDGHVTPEEHALDPALHDLFGAVQLPGREELAVGQVREAQPLAAHAHEPLGVRVPGGQIFVSDRPVDAVAVLPLPLELEVAPAPAQPAPDQAAAAELVAPDPAERLIVGRDVRM